MPDTYTPLPTLAEIDKYDLGDEDKRRLRLIQWMDRNGAENRHVAEILSLHPQQITHFRNGTSPVSPARIRHLILRELYNDALQRIEELETGRAVQYDEYPE